MRVVSRFAPAPSGHLHLGHVVNAIYVWGVTRALGGRVLLRVEDHDRRRSRPDYEASILADLAWLGFVPDEGPVRQSERTSIYDAALADLDGRDLVYACRCSRSDIAAQAEDGGRGADAEIERRYPGICAGLGLADGPGRGMRVRLAAGAEHFDDWCHGPREQRPYDQCGDLLARDRDGHWTYQFAAAVDDLAQGVTLVIRGDDLLPSTGRQIQLARMLGRPDPAAFLHHPLIMKSSTQKLSKSDGDSGVRDLRAQGWRPGQVIGQAAALVGLIEHPGDMTADATAGLFDAYTRRYA
ncbi:MAG: glutamate--tRNA ligase family protein [Acidobacteriota bacterium]